MKVERRDEGDIAILEVSGRLAGGEDAEELRSSVAALVRENARKVLIDLSGVPWMNSSGVGALVSAYSSLRNSGAHIRFLNLNERVRSILQISRLLHVLESYSEKDEAIASLRNLPE